MPTAVSLFSGCGGSDAGLVSAGFDVLMANDILTYASEVYKANLPDTDYRVCSIENIKKFPKADLLVGCYPCQGYSQGGAREANRPINLLFKEFGRALRAIKPKAFIVENVSGLTREDNLALFQMQLRNFRSAGYKVKWSLLNAADYGVAQERKRVLIVGIRSDQDVGYEFPKPTHGSTARKPYLTIREALSGLPEWPEGEFNEEPFHWYYMSRNRRRDWHELSKTIVSHARHMPLHPVSPPLIYAGKDKYIFTNDSQARRFSYREAACLQGFKRNIIFPDSCGMYTRYKVVGNAVPPPLFKAVAKAIPAIW
ncbi:DNA cytosine methyltransferase [Lysobacter capsici]|uniref:DNA cytosine methyltransferase n=1 Tax=Lysobacter capsici TaxID=435897 RepID=UPI001C00792A|nr:DNA cytosine methyltransferase [Lysobacter capsici]QWF17726.1 DNA cytosine methyltransferase [Lysobacter capsici]